MGRPASLMELVYFTLWFMVTAATIWDMRRTQLQSQVISRDIQASVERIATMTAEVLRRTPER